jgi:hypothetical protein
MDWKSSVLRCYDADHGCKLCQFIEGNRDKDVMLETIRILDEKLASQEAYTRSLTRLLAEDKVS